MLPTPPKTKEMHLFGGRNQCYLPEMSTVQKEDTWSMGGEYSTFVLVTYNSKGLKKGACEWTPVKFQTLVK